MNPELPAVARKINALEEDIGRQCQQLTKFAASEKLTTALASYDKSVEIALVKLQSEGVPATVAKDRAKGMCESQLFAVKSLEIKWKAMQSILRATESRLNGQQSIYRHFSEI